MRYLVILAFIGILASLTSSLVFMMKDQGKSKRMVNSLTVRIGLSVALFLFVLFVNQMSWIQSTGLR